MLRASWQGLSFALPTVTRARATHPWNVAHYSRSQPAVRVGRGGQLLATRRTQTAKDDVVPSSGPLLEIPSSEAGSSGQDRGGVLQNASEGAATPALDATPTTSGIGSREIRRWGRSKLSRVVRVRPEKPGKKIKRTRPAKRNVEQGHIPPNHAFRGQSLRRSVDPARWLPHVTAPRMKAIDDAWESQTEPSPSLAIYRSLESIARGKALRHVWESYMDLIQIQRTYPVVQEQFPPSRVPSVLLVRLCHLIIHSRPFTHSHYPSLLMVMQHMWDKGRKDRRPTRLMWNSLINFAAKGRRGGGEDGIQRSLAALNDFICDLRPGSTIPNASKLTLPAVLDTSSPNQPDIYTFGTLIHIASNAMDSELFEDANRLLEESGLPPTRITRLSCLEFYTRKKQMDDVRRVIWTMREDGMDLGIDGLNACIWAFTNTGQDSKALDIYRILRNNVEADPDPDAIHRLRNDLEAFEHIHVPNDATPDSTTYVSLIQTMAYHGRFTETTSIFADFLASAPRLRLGPSTAPAFRAVFLGFSKYAIGRLEVSADPNHPHRQWDLESLQAMYRTFLTMPYGVVPSRSTIFWIMVAFDKASDRDVDHLRAIWLELENHFEPMAPWLFQQGRLQRIKNILFANRDEHR